jgi:hypothetical protein
MLPCPVGTCEGSIHFRPCRKRGAWFYGYESLEASQPHREHGIQLNSPHIHRPRAPTNLNIT